jgi:hypothetical protein
VDSGSLIAGFGGALTVDGSVSLQNLAANQGTVTVNGSLDTQNLQIDRGTLTGPGDASVENFFGWFAGTMSGSGHTVLNGTTSISAGFAQLNGRTVDNHGTATVFAGNAFVFNTSGVWNNDADGTLILQSNGNVNGNSAASARLNNDGLVQKVGPGNATIGVALNNNADGTVDVEGGTLTLTTGSSRGAFTVAAGAILTFNEAPASTYALQDGASSSGAGDVQVNATGAVTTSGAVSLENLSIPGGTVTVNAASLTTANLNLTNRGTLTGRGDVTVTGNLFWVIGTMSGTGQTTLEGTSTLMGGFFSLLQDRTVNNDGVAVFAHATSGDGIDIFGAGVWNNDAGATSILPDTGGVGDFIAGQSAAFHNAGLLQKTGTGTSTISVPLTNTETGTLEIQAGTLSLGFFPGPFQTAGTVTIAAGSTFLVGSYTQTAGATTVDGTLTVVHSFFPSGVFLNGGVLGGSGVINGDVTNAADLAPGDSPGVLTINDNYTQTAAGALDVEIGGPTVGTQYDRLVINGTASLAGALNAIILSNYVPDVGQAFQVLTFRSHTGDFDTENGLDLGGGRSLTPVHNAADTNLSLVAQSG